MEMWGKTEEGLVVEDAEEAWEGDSDSQSASPAISVRSARCSSHGSPQYSSDTSDSPSSLDLCQASSVDISAPDSRATTDKSLPLSRRFNCVFLSSKLGEIPPLALRICSSHGSPQYSSDRPSSLDLCQASSVEISAPDSRATTDNSQPLSRRFDCVFLSSNLEEQPPPALRICSSHGSPHYSSDTSDSPSSLDLCQASSVEISAPDSRATTDHSQPLSRRFDCVFLSSKLEEQPPPALRALVREHLGRLPRGKEALVELRRLYRGRQHCPPVSAADRLPELCSFCGDRYENSTKCESCLTILCLDCSGLYPGGRCLICRLRGLKTPVFFMRGQQCPICFEPAKAIRQWVVCARCKNTLCNGCNTSWGRRCPFCRGIDTLLGSS